MVERVFGSLFRYAGASGRWVVTALEAVFLLALLVAGALFFTGRGLQFHAGWARVVATLFIRNAAGFVGRNALRPAQRVPGVCPCGVGERVRHLGHAAQIHPNYSVNSAEDCRTSSSTLIEAMAGLPISNVADAPLESRESERSA